jgi:hypothetical protein
MEDEGLKMPPPPKTGVIDLDHPYRGRIGDEALMQKYKNVIIGLDGDYRLPLDLKQAVEKVGQDFVKYAETNGIDLAQYGFDINGDGKVGMYEAGSGCAALALDHGRRDVKGKPNRVVSVLRADGSFEVLRALKGENWRAAEQILGDTWPDQVKTPTNTKEADAAFLGRYKSSNSSLIGGERE